MAARSSFVTIPYTRSATPPGTGIDGLCGNPAWETATSRAYDYLRLGNGMIIALVHDDRHTCASRELVVVARAATVPYRPLETGSVESQCQSQGRVDLLEFGEADVTDEFPEPFGRHSGGLFGEQLCLFLADCDCGTEDARRRRAGRRHNEDRRQQQVIGLHDDRVAGTALFIAASTAGRAQTVNVTTHGARPSP